MCDSCVREGQCPLRELLSSYSASLGLETEVSRCRQYQETPRAAAMRELFFGDYDEQAN